VSAAVRLALVAVLIAIASGDATADRELTLGATVMAADREDGRWGFVPELVARTGIELGALELRPGARLWMRGLDQPELPTGVALRERDLGGAAELGIARPLRLGGLGTVVPSLGVGAGPPL
jgi:outer membrane scaffolding protein for murein synthesis (MipA/OmpV family)